MRFSCDWLSILDIPEIVAKRLNGKMSSSIGWDVRLLNRCVFFVLIAFARIALHT